MRVFDWLDTMAVTSLSAFANGVIIGTLLCLVVWGIVRVMGKWVPVNATTRFFVWMTLFVVCIGLVGWQGWTRLDFAVANSAESNAERVYEVPTPPAPPIEATAPVVPMPPANPPEPVAPLVPEVIPPEPVAPIVPDVAPEPLPASAVPAAPNAAAADELAYYEEAAAMWAAPRQIEITGLSPVWRVLLFTIWATVAGMLLIRVCFGWYGIRVLKASSYPASDRVQSLLRQTLQQIRQPREVQVAISDDIATAVAVGYWKPRILLPAGMVTSLSQTELQQVLLHEAAHLQRWDDWTMLLQRIVGALLFFHPGIVLLGKLMDRDREYACDDWVIALTRRPKTYASCLAKLVSQYARKQPPAFVPGFSSEKEALFDRIKSILDKKRSISFRISRLAYTGLLAAMVFVLFLMVRFVPVVALPAHHAIVQTSALLETELPSDEDNISDPVIARDDLAVLLADASAPVIAPLADMPGNAPVPELAQFAVMPADPGAPAVILADVPTGLDRDDANVAALSDELASIGGAPAQVTYGLAFTDGPLQSLPVARQPVRVRKDSSSLSTRSMAKILRSAGRIPSSGDKAQVLLNAVKKMQFDAVVFDAFLDAVKTIPSSGDQAKVLLALVDYQQLDEASAVRFLRVASRIPSSGDKSRVLLKSLKGDSLPLNKETVQDGFLEAIDHLGSSDDMRKVLKAFMSHRRTVEN